MNAFMKFAEVSMQECSLAKLAKEMPGKSLDIRELDKPLSAESAIRRSLLPIEGHGGTWSGERGNSNWHPDPEYIPPDKNGTNPDQLPWKDIMDKYGIDHIPFKDGEPDFSAVSKGTVEITDFSTDRDANFSQADEELAKQKGCTPEEVAKWRKDNGYTWHERNDCKTMDKVPTEVHGNVSHSGGISIAKARMQEEDNGKA
jgi:hypothetical protein